MKKSPGIGGGAFDRAYRNRIWEAEKQLTMIRGVSIIIGFILWVADYAYVTRQFSVPVRFTLALLSIASFQSVVSYYVVFIRGKYTPAIKYFNQFLDIVTVTGLIYVYKLGNYHDYAQVYMSARNYLYYIVIVFAAIRIDPKLVIGSGILSIALYSAFIIYGNNVNGLVFSSSVRGQRALYLLDVSILEITLRVVFLGMFTAITWFQVMNQLRLLMEAVSSERESRELKRENELIERVNYENRKYLDNMDEGLLILDGNLAAGNLYSESTKDIFGTSAIKGRAVASLFYPDGDREKTAELERFLRLLLKNKNSDSSLFEEINPLKSAKIRVPSLSNPSGYEDKYLSASFKQIRDNSGAANVIVLISDDTEKRRLEEQVEKESVKHQQEIEIIARLLETDPGDIDEFLGDAGEVLGEIAGADNFPGGRDEYNRIFNALHSLKGISASLGFFSVSSLVHEAETALGRCKEGLMPSNAEDENPLPGGGNGTFAGAIEAVRGELADISMLRERLGNFVRTMNRRPGAASGPIDRIRVLLEKTVRRTAELLGKEARLDFSGTIDEPGKIAMLGELKGVLVHLVNNSLDHGIEFPAERIRRGKDAAGIISVSLKTGNGNFTAAVADDGAGIDTEAFRRSLILEGRIADSPGARVPEALIYRTLFEPGFSSRDRVSLTSGRGVGLAAAAALLKKYNGKIKVKNLPGKGLGFTMVFPLGGNKNPGETGGIPE